jgi:hypothetical protein
LDANDRSIFQATSFSFRCQVLDAEKRATVLEQKLCMFLFLCLARTVTQIRKPDCISIFLFIFLVRTSVWIDQHHVKDQF